MNRYLQNIIFIVTDEDVEIPSRRREKVLARMLYTHVMREHYRKDFFEIAGDLGYSAVSTASLMYQRCLDAVKYDPEYIELMNKLLKYGVGGLNCSNVPEDPEKETRASRLSMFETAFPQFDALYEAGLLREASEKFETMAKVLLKLNKKDGK